MRKLLVIVALGMGLGMIGGADTAQALPKKIQRKSRGVKMKCDARTRMCKFKSKRLVKMKCRYKVRFVVKRRGHKRRRLVRTGRVKLRPRGKRIKRFYRGPGEVKGFIKVSVFCHKK